MNKKVAPPVAQPGFRGHKKSSCLMFFLSLTTLALWEKENTWVIEVTEVSFLVTGMFTKAQLVEHGPEQAADVTLHPPHPQWVPWAPYKAANLAQAWGILPLYICKTEVQTWGHSLRAWGSLVLGILDVTRLVKVLMVPQMQMTSKRTGHGDLHSQHTQLLNSHRLHWDKDI